jgi:uncharacterized membrane protein
MWIPGRKKLEHLVDAERVQRAIEDAERRTSGEIMVSFAPFFVGSVQRAAEHAFDRLGVWRTRDRNGVLFFVVPSRRRFVVLGDTGIHRVVGDEFWQHVARAMSLRFHAGDVTGGLVEAIGEVGERLAAAFPYDAARDANELPDQPVGHA